MKQRVAAIVLGFIVQLGGLVLIHSVWLRADYVATASLWRALPDQKARAWAMAVAVLIYVVAAVLLYKPGPSGSSLASGLRYGALLAAAVVVYGSLSAWVILPLSHLLVVKWIVGESALSLLFGVLVARILRPGES